MKTDNFQLVKNSLVSQYPKQYELFCDEIKTTSITVDEEKADQPILMFLVPGIRADGRWAKQFKAKMSGWGKKEVKCVPVRGNLRNSDRLSSWHLLTRIGLISFRQSFKLQISEVTKLHEGYSVSIVAHSMGSVLVGEIIDDVKKELLSHGRELDSVFFIGGICPRKHSYKISQCTKKFVNHIGVRDSTSYLASIVRPFHYNDVGFHGFVDSFTEDRTYDNDHVSCTSLEHLEKKVLPELLDGIYTENYPLPSRRYSYKCYVYFRRIFWIILSPLMVLNNILNLAGLLIEIAIEKTKLHRF